MPDYELFKDDPKAMKITIIVILFLPVVMILGFFLFKP